MPKKQNVPSLKAEQENKADIQKTTLSPSSLTGDSEEVGITEGQLSVSPLPHESFRVGA